MIDLDLGAPLDRHRATVLPEWIDWNGHMNVGYYVVAFDKATDVLCEQFGCSWEYTKQKIGMTFVREAHVTYDQAVKQGDTLRITTQSLGRRLKQLVDEGYVLQKEGADDRRHRLLFVTPKGEQLAMKLAGLQTERIARALADLGPNAHQSARDFLAAMIDTGSRDEVLRFIAEADRARQQR